MVEPTSTSLTARDVVPVLIAVVGWLIGHAFALRAQTKAFRNQVLDRARLDITEKIRDYQNLLSELSAWIRGLNLLKPALEYGLPVDFTAKCKELLAFQGRKVHARAWAIATEDYQILFPETTLARQWMDMRHVRLSFELEPVFRTLLGFTIKKPTVLEYDALVKDAEMSLSLIDDQTALLEDLRVHLQNVTLSKIMDRSIPFREPPDAAVPRLKLTKEKVLEVVDGLGRTIKKDDLRFPTA